MSARQTYTHGMAYSLAKLRADGAVYGAPVAGRDGEVACAIDGEGVSIFDVATGRLIDSYAAAPGTLYDCAPAASYDRAAKTRRTYASHRVKEASEIVLWIEVGGDRKARRIAKRAHARVHALYLDAKLTVVLQSGEVFVLDLELAQSTPSLGPLPADVKCSAYGRKLYRCADSLYVSSNGHTTKTPLAHPDAKLAISMAGEVAALDKNRLHIGSTSLALRGDSVTWLGERHVVVAAASAGHVVVDVVHMAVVARLQTEGRLACASPFLTYGSHIWVTPLDLPKEPSLSDAIGHTTSDGELWARDVPLASTWRHDLDGHLPSADACLRKLSEAPDGNAFDTVFSAFLDSCGALRSDSLTNALVSRVYDALYELSLCSDVPAGRTMSWLLANPRLDPNRVDGDMIARLYPEAIAPLLQLDLPMTTAVKLHRHGETATQLARHADTLVVDALRRSLTPAQMEAWLIRVGESLLEDPSTASITLATNLYDALGTAHVALSRDCHDVVAILSRIVGALTLECERTAQAQSTVEYLILQARQASRQRQAQPAKKPSARQQHRQVGRYTVDRVEL